MTSIRATRLGPGADACVAVYMLENGRKMYEARTVYVSLGDAKILLDDLERALSVSQYDTGDATLEHLDDLDQRLTGLTDQVLEVTRAANQISGWCKELSYRIADLEGEG